MSAPESNVPKRRCMQRWNLDSDEDLLAVTSNMVNKGKNPVVEENSSDTEIEEAHHYTRLKISVMELHDYKRLLGGLDEEYEEHRIIRLTPRSHASSQPG